MKIKLELTKEEIDILNDIVEELATKALTGEPRPDLINKITDSFDLSNEPESDRIILVSILAKMIIKSAKNFLDKLGEKTNSIINSVK